MGFTHICGRSREKGYFTIHRKTIGERMAGMLKEIRQQIPRRMHDTTGKTGNWLNSLVRGYFQYHAIRGNEQRLWAFREDVLRVRLRALRRPSQKSRWT